MKRFIKPLFSAAVLASVLIFAGCGGDKDPVPLSTSKLVGTWTGVSTQTFLMVGGKSYKQFLIDEIGVSEEDAEIYNAIVEEMLTLTGFWAEFEVKADYRWTGDSDYVTEPVHGGWKLSSDEKKLTLTNDSEPGVEQVADITRLTDTELWLEIVPDIAPPQGAPAGFSSRAVIKMVRKK